MTLNVAEPKLTINNLGGQGGSCPTDVDYTCSNDVNEEPIMKMENVGTHNDPTIGAMQLDLTVRVAPGSR